MQKKRDLVTFEGQAPNPTTPIVWRLMGKAFRSWYLFGSSVAFTAFAVLMAITAALGQSALLPFNFGVLSGALLGTCHYRQKGASAMLRAILKRKGLN